MSLSLHIVVPVIHDKDRSYCLHQHMLEQILIREVLSIDFECSVH